MTVTIHSECHTKLIPAAFDATDYKLLAFTRLITFHISDAANSGDFTRMQEPPDIYISRITPP
jgi:hypothetical protein